MSERLNAPARSPLRRILAASGKDSPIRGKQSKSPVRRSDVINWAKQRSTAIVDNEAEKIREQAIELEVEHDIAHLTPALQRFWQVIRIFSFFCTDKLLICISEIKIWGFIATFGTS
jgi:hypothetical protein